MNKPVWVFDTNVVLDLFHFDDPAARPLRVALEAGRVACVASAATLGELQRVLAYPEFALDEAQQTAILARYAALCRTLDVPGRCGALPRCSDPDDQKFLELAAASQAHALVTKDQALLKLRPRCASRFRVWTPGEAARTLGQGAPQPESCG